MELEFDMNANREKIDELKQFIRPFKTKPGSLMAILHKAQMIFGYLPLEVQNIISKEMNIPLAQVYGVATFYSHFSLVPKGKHEIAVCLGTACYVRGAQNIMDKINEELKIKPGETTEDLNFSLEATRCIGACGLAPVMTVSGDVYGKLTPGEVTKILSKYKEA